MKFVVLILALLILPACGGFSLFKDSKLTNRQLASEPAAVAADFQDELHSLHHYYLLSQKYSATTDETKSFVIKTKLEEIESELLKMNSKALRLAVSDYSGKSDVASISMKNLGLKLGLKRMSKVTEASPKSVEEAIRLAEVTNEFQILSMNIEHLTHMMNLKLKNTPPRKTSLDWTAQHPDKIVKRAKKLI